MKNRKKKLAEKEMSLKAQLETARGDNAILKLELDALRTRNYARQAELHELLSKNRMLAGYVGQLEEIIRAATHPSRNDPLKGGKQNG